MFASPCASHPPLTSQAELHTRLCDYDSALRLLALVIADVDGAIAYCRQHGGQEGWLALLDMFLRPGGCWRCCRSLALNTAPAGCFCECVCADHGWGMPDEEAA
jgi:hypothetical protein